MAQHVSISITGSITEREQLDALVNGMVEDDVLEHLNGDEDRIRAFIQQIANQGTQLVFGKVGEEAFENLKAQLSDAGLSWHEAHQADPVHALQAYSVVWTPGMKPGGETLEAAPSPKEVLARLRSQEKADVIAWLEKLADPAKGFPRSFSCDRDLFSSPAAPGI